MQSNIFLDDGSLKRHVRFPTENVSTFFLKKLVSRCLLSLNTGGVHKISLYR